jgi:hypothetical protein
MQVIRRKSDKVAVYLFDDDAQISFDGFMISPVRAFDIKPETHEVVQNVPAPTTWLGAALSYDSGWVVIDQPGIDALLTRRLAEAKEAKRAAVNSIRDEKLALGYPHDFGQPHGVKTLDTRTEIDRTNWLGAGQLYSAQIAEGNGAVVGATLRTSDNTNITLAFQDALNVILSMGVYTGSILSLSWSLKDQLEAAPDHSALAAIDITAGWP